MIAQLLERSLVQSCSARRRWPAGSFAPDSCCWCPRTVGPRGHLAAPLWCPNTYFWFRFWEKKKKKVSWGSYLYAIICSNPDIHGGNQNKLFPPKVSDHQGAENCRGRKPNPSIHQNTHFFCLFSSLKWLSTRWGQEHAATKFHFSSECREEMFLKEEGEISWK